MTDLTAIALHATAKTTAPTGAGLVITRPDGTKRVFDELTLDSVLQKQDLAAVALSGSYADLADKPTIPTQPTIPKSAALLASDASGNLVPVTLGSGFQLVNGVISIVSGGSGSTSGSTTTTASTQARFAQDTATAGTPGTAAALFASMTQVSGGSSARTGTMTTTADQSKYTWVAVLASAAGSGMHFFDGTGYGGFNGANSTSIYTGPDADPTTISQAYTDSSGTAWNLYRSSGHSVALTFTLS